MGIALGAFLVVSIGFYLLQDKFVFQGKTLAEDYVFNFDQDFTEYFIPAGDKVKLNALLFKTSLPSKGLILYFHGNADNLQRWGAYAVDFTSLGYDIFMIDYRGYGKSTGTPTEANLYKDALTVWSWSHSNIPSSRTILYGRSLGSAVASQLATIHTPYRLILETPFDELRGTLYAPARPVLTAFPLRSQFPNKTFLPRVVCPITIIHGTDDWVVPLSSALQLKSLLKNGDQFEIIEGGGHRNLRDFENFHKVLAGALE